MIFYHATSKEAAAALMTSGASVEMIGAKGGLQTGCGFYVAPSIEYAQKWQRILGAEVILKVELPDSAKVLPFNFLLDHREEFRAHLIEMGLPKETTFAGQARLVFAAQGLDYDAVMGRMDASSKMLFGLTSAAASAYAKAHGYAAMYEQDSTDDEATAVVIVDFDLLKGSAFSIA